MSDFHEVWWIYAPLRGDWGGIRIAHFTKTLDGTMVCIILGETPDRSGPRVWADIEPREGWVKVKLIPFPTAAEVNYAVDSKLTEIVGEIKKEHGFE